MNSLAIVTRAYDAEAPYINSFIEYYKNIGVNEFHIVVPKGNRYEVLEGECADIEDVTLYFDYECSEDLKHFNAAQNIALPKVKASHILSIDIDEYLDTDDVNALLEHDYLLFKWVIAPFSVFNSTKVLGFEDAQCKYLVKTSLCKRLAIHDCELYTPIKPTFSQVKLIHYVYRSFNDLFLKCALSNYQSYQKTEVHQFYDGIEDSSNLPLKFKMAAIYQRISQASAKYQVPFYCEIDIACEKRLIESTVYKGILTELQAAFLNYYSRINLHKLISDMCNSDSYKMLGRVPHFKLAEFSDASLIDNLAPKQWQVNPTKTKSKIHHFLKKLKSSFS